MSVDIFINKAWQDHALHSEEVATRFHDGFSLIENSDQIGPMAILVTHVIGEHLGQWQSGIDYLRQLESSPVLISSSESHQIIKRSIASLELAADQRPAIAEFSISEQVRILSNTASILGSQKQPDRASKFLKQAVHLLTQTELEKTDPSFRSLAVSGNNLAVTLEEKTDRTEEYNDLMIFAAQTARTYWEIAGTWVELERAEYRLANTFFQAGEYSKALMHAQRCLEISVNNHAPALELFFGYEILAIVNKKLNQTSNFLISLKQLEYQFTMLEEEDKSWCEETLRKIRSLS